MFDKSKYITYNTANLSGYKIVKKTSIPVKLFIDVVGK